jgi:hypothetical protein
MNCVEKMNELIYRQSLQEDKHHSAKEGAIEQRTHDSDSTWSRYAGTAGSGVRLNPHRRTQNNADDDSRDHHHYFDADYHDHDRITDYDHHATESTRGKCEHQHYELH